jgi:hypothetical protein
MRGSIGLGKGGLGEPWTLHCVDSLVTVKETPTGVHLVQAGSTVATRQGPLKAKDNLGRAI